MISVVSIFQVSVAGMGPAHDGNMQHSVQSLAEFGCLIKCCNSEMLNKKQKTNKQKSKPVEYRRKVEQSDLI